MPSLLSPPRKATHAPLTPPLTPSSTQSTSSASTTIGENASRLLKILDVPSTVNAEAIRTSFQAFGEIKGVFVRLLQEHGIIIVVFYDVRHAAAAHARVLKRPTEFFPDATIHAEFLNLNQLLELTGPSSIVQDSAASLSLSFNTIDPPRRSDVLQVLTSYGEVRSLIEADRGNRVFYAEFFDSRSASAAFQILSSTPGISCSVMTSGFSIEQNDESDSELKSRGIATTPPTLSRRISTGSFRPSELSTPTLTHSHSSDNIKKRHSIDIGKRDGIAASQGTPSPSSPLRPWDSFVDDNTRPETSEPAQSVRHNNQSEQMHSPLSPHAQPFSSPTPHTSPVYYNYPVHHEPPYGPLIDLGYPAAGLNPDAMAYSQPPWNWLPPNQLQSATSFLNTPALTNVIIPDNGAQDPVTQVSNLLTNYTPMREVGVAHPSATPLRNVLDFEKIEAGQDTRTTVMIKNIPNKMTDKDLLTYIHAICPRKIDFMYLRIDFNNHCNVGYAFVNFIEVSDLLLFAKTKLGTRWNMFSSEKVLQMSYANYQGKEALIEKFKNSCIMGEREGWRPKIFYSHGKKQGLPEPFPEPTNAKRVERAQQTRGPLWASQQGNLSPARDSALWTKMRNPNQQNRSLSPKGQNREHNPIHRRLANNS